MPASVERFRRWGDDLIDRWDGQTMVRVLHLPAGPVAYAAENVGTVERPRLRVTAERPAGMGPDRAREAVDASGLAIPSESDRVESDRVESDRVESDRVESDRVESDRVESDRANVMSDTIAGMFAQADMSALIREDPAMAAADARFPGVRPVLERDPLTALLRSVSAQQINLAFASVVRRRLVQAYGRRHVVAGREVWSFDAAALAGADPAAIRELQFTTRKAEYIVAIARKVVDEPAFFAELPSLPDEEVVARLMTLPGIGRWTAEWYLARTLGRPVVAAGDLGVRKAVGRAYFEGRIPSEQEVRKATAHWGAAAGVAQQLLLEALYAGPALSSPSA